MDILAAVNFIEQHGTPLQIALMRYALGALTASDVLSILTPLQHVDGHWQSLHAIHPAEPMQASAEALQVLRWLSADNHALMHRSAGFFAQHQNITSGTWDTLPPSNAPVIQHRLTATIARMLMETGHETYVYFGRALNHLARAWEADTVDDPLTLIMMLPLFHIGGQKSDGALVEACNTRLLAQVAADQLPVSVVIAAAHAALVTRYAGSKLYVAARDRALMHQQADGGWADHRLSIIYRTQTTVEALMLLRVGGML